MSLTTADLEPEFSDKGTDIMTPLPVPIHSRWRLIIIEVMRTKEKPSFPVPDHQEDIWLVNVMWREELQQVHYLTS